MSTAHEAAMKATVNTFLVSIIGAKVVLDKERVKLDPMTLAAVCGALQTEFHTTCRRKMTTEEHDYFAAITNPFTGFIDTIQIVMRETSPFGPINLRDPETGKIIILDPDNN